ncbi:MAG: M15 family metallopeptidase [Mycobacteriales bacterium]
MREGVAERLAVAAGELPRGVRLVLAEGYRPLQQQNGYFDMYSGALAAEHPDWSAARLRVAASRFVAPPELAPHVTGAAVDVLLVDGDGRDLDLGTPLNSSPEETHEACFTAATGISSAARTYRRLLIEAMAAAGFVNYPTEWWHWSFGDRYWAAVTGAVAARYGPVDVTI